MIRASRIVFQKAPIRPVAHELRAASNGSKKPDSASPGASKVTPFGLAAILGGLALGTYLLKPSKAVPAAAMDTFKPRIAIVFALGDSKDTLRKSAPNLGFHYIDVSTDLEKLDTLVKQGNSKFFIEGFTNEKEYEKICAEVVNPDLVLDFSSGLLQDAPRIVKLDRSADPEAVAKILQQKNLI